MPKVSLSPLERQLMMPLVKHGWGFWALVSGLVAVIGLGVYAYTIQLEYGMAVTGLRDRISWGLYVGTFVFFIGVSYGGTLVSAVLRLTNAKWRTPITRLAEATTAFSLLVATTMIIVDLGRPERAASLFLRPQLESPLVWDFVAIMLYLVGSLIYLYLPLIPDLATLAEKLPRRRARFRRLIYARLAAGWRGLPEQRRALARGIGAMTVLIIPVAVSAHTVTAWVFGLTLRVGWHTALLGPYFVVGALFSGVATVILVMAIVRRALHLEAYLTPAHFRNMGILLLVFDVALLYFTLSEYLTAFYGGEAADVAWVSQLARGPYSLLFWGMVLGGFLAPLVLFVVTRGRNVAAAVVAALLVNVGMWLERYLIVVGSLSTPQTPAEVPLYWPTWIEWSVLAASVAGFALLLVLFAKLVPLVSMSEFAEAKGTPEPVAEPGGVVS